MVGIPTGSSSLSASFCITSHPYSASDTTKRASKEATLESLELTIAKADGGERGGSRGKRRKDVPLTRGNNLDPSILVCFSRTKRSSFKM